MGLQPTFSDLHYLLVFPFLSSPPHIIDKLKLEIPKYLEAAEDISPTVSLKLFDRME